MSTSNNEQPILKKLKPNEEKAIETSSSSEKTIKMENIDHYFFYKHNIRDDDS